MKFSHLGVNETDSSQKTTFDDAIIVDPFLTFEVESGQLVVRIDAAVKPAAIRQLETSPETK